MKNFTKMFLAICLLAGFDFSLNAQNVGINDDGSQPQNSAMLDVKSSNKGLLIPRMTQTARNQIVGPANGLLIFQTDNIPGFYYYNGSAWTHIGSGIEAEIDPIFGAHAASGITPTLIGNWNSAYGWGNHAGLYRPIGYMPDWTEITSNPFSFSSLANNQLLKYNSTSGKWENWTPDFLSSYTETDPDFTASAAHSISTTNITNWNTAYGWGNHATAGYLTSFTETDPIWTASPSHGISNTNITNWNSAYGWGNHASAGYLTSFTETDPLWAASPSHGISNTNITNWNSAYGWYRHYFTSLTWTYPASLNILNTPALLSHEKPTPSAI